MFTLQIMNRSSTPLPLSSTSQPIHSCKHRERHDAMPFNSLSDIDKMSEYFIINHQYRNNLLLIAGINFGIRISDLLSLHVNDLVNNNFTIKQSFEILEQKTSHLKKESSNGKTYLKRKNRIVGINQSVCKALRLYIENTPDITLNDYLFQNKSRNNTTKENKPMTRKATIP